MLIDSKIDRNSLEYILFIIQTTREISVTKDLYEAEICLTSKQVSNRDIDL